MAIYTQDVIKHNGQVISGEPVDGKPELRMPYRIAQSINDGGHRYVFSHMDNGEAVYKLSDTVIADTPSPVAAITGKVKSMASGGVNVLIELPPDAIADYDFVGGVKTIGNRRYRLYQPVSKFNGMFVYVPADRAETF